jgi:hypothetical protein
VADADDVTIRHPGTLERRTVRRSALPFFPGWELLDKAGRKAARQPDSASSTAKSADTTTEE